MGLSGGGCLPDVDLGEGRVTAQCMGVWAGCVGCMGV